MTEPNDAAAPRLSGGGYLRALAWHHPVRYWVITSMGSYGALSLGRDLLALAGLRGHPSLGWSVLTAAVTAAVATLSLRRSRPRAERSRPAA